MPSFEYLGLQNQADHGLVYTSTLYILGGHWHCVHALEKLEKAMENLEKLLKSFNVEKRICMAYCTFYELEVAGLFNKVWDLY